ncbi:MAG: LemA family protein [Bryobacteraceae bacterium]
MRLLVMVVAAVVAVLGVKCVAVNKDLLSERRAIDSDWAQVDGALTHRAAVVPDLTATIQSEEPAKAGAALDTAAQAANDARTALDSTHAPPERILANARLDQALARLMLQVENYPKLENSKKYADLLEALKSADYQIAVARRKYNEAVEHYNARLDLFPDNIVASVTRLGKVDAYFQTPAI